MSDPKRFDPLSDGMWENSAGDYVLYADYARIKAEVERLKADVERLTFDPLTYLDDQGEWMPRHIHIAAVERLKAEVERLRKAGDAMADHIETGWVCRERALKGWNAAKEGKQS